jgi:lysophospholipase L1-like esterase
MFGDYVNDDETFPAALERILRRANGGSEIETVNAGVNGYTISDEADLAREKGMALHPDLVIVGFVLNDLADLTRRVSTRENQRREAQVMSTSPLTPVKDALRRTATYNFLFVLKASILARTGADPTIQALPIDHLLHPPFDATTEALFARYEEDLAKLAELCRASGARLLLVLFPFYEQVVKDAPADAQARMTEIAARVGVPVLDLLPAFRRAGSRAGRLFLMPLDHHPSATGYRVAAREVSRAEGPWIREKRAALDAP